MDGDRNDRQVEIVEHDWNVMVEAFSRVEVEAEGPSADQGNRGDVCQPVREEEHGFRCTRTKI